MVPSAVGSEPVQEPTNKLGHFEIFVFVFFKVEHEERANKSSIFLHNDTNNGRGPPPFPAQL